LEKATEDIIRVSLPGFSRLISGEIKADAFADATRIPAEVTWVDSDSSGWPGETIACVYVHIDKGQKERKEIEMERDAL
jgi:hypothetical protein